MFCKVLPNAFTYPCSITEISTVSPPGLMRSALTTLDSRESYITVTWTPTASQQGSSIFCYTAVDNFGYVITNTACLPVMLTSIVYIDSKTSLRRASVAMIPLGGMFLCNTVTFHSAY